MSEWMAVWCSAAYQVKLQQASLSSCTFPAALKSTIKMPSPVEPSSLLRSILVHNRYLFTHLVLFCSYQVGSIPKTKQITRELVSFTDTYLSVLKKKYWRSIYTEWRKVFLIQETMKFSSSDQKRGRKIKSKGLHHGIDSVFPEDESNKVHVLDE